MFARVRKRLHRLVGPRGVLVVAAAVLATAGWNAWVALDRMEDARSYYSSLTPAERENEIELALGFEFDVWDELRRSVRDDDRFTVVSDAFEQHEVRNYAAYALLPAIQVSTVDEATVVLHWKSPPPPGSECRRLAAYLCLQRRGA
jgi:hypothetical protein